MKIRKAVFPVAGLGTRFLPATKAMPKEMLPIVDKPLIQYAVEEAFQSGIEQIIFVTGRNKEALEDHFDRHNGLESTLMEKNKTKLLDSITKIVPDTVTIVYTRQSKPMGLGHAIWCARDIVGNEPFAVLLADDLIKSKTPVLAQMMKAYEKTQSSLVAVVEVPKNETDKYGILDADQSKDGLSKIRGLVEKPSPDEAPSNLAIIGRYILNPEIFAILDQKEKGAGGEIQLTDAMAKLLDTQSIFGLQFEGQRFDCGDKAGFQMANLSFALSHPDISSKLKPFIKTLLE